MIGSTQNLPVEPPWPPRSKNLQLLSKYSRRSVNLLGFLFTRLHIRHGHIIFVFRTQIPRWYIFSACNTTQHFHLLFICALTFFIVCFSFYYFFLAACVRSSWLHFVGLCFGFWSYLQPFDGSRIEPPTRNEAHEWRQLSIATCGGERWALSTA